MVNEDEVLFKGNPEIAYPKAPGRGISFKCFKCPSIFDRKEALLTHSSLHGANKSFKCHMCDYSVNSSELLSKHMSKHKSRPKFSSVKDGKRQQSESPRESKSPSTPKYPSNSPSSKHQCSECPATYADPRHLRTHIANHNSGQSKECNKCSFSTRRGDILEKHLLVHVTSVKEKSPLIGKQKDGHLSCPECPDVFRSQRDYSRHLDRHGAGDKFGCSICSFSVNKQDLLHEHLHLHKNNSSFTSPNYALGKKAHKPSDVVESEKQKQRTSDSDEAGNRSQDNSVPRCRKCPYECKSRIDMRKHERTHGGKGVYKCSFCDYATHTYTHKFNHEKLHQKPSKSSSVSKIASKIALRTFQASTKFQSKKDGNSTLRYTVPPESYEKLRKGNPRISYEPFYQQSKDGRKRLIATYKCFNCPYQSHDYNGLVNHQVYHDGTKREYQCHICDYSTVSEKKLIKHMIVHGPSAMSSKGKHNKKLTLASASAKVLPIPIIGVSPRKQDTKDIISPTTIRATPISFQELYSTEPSDKLQSDTSKYLVERMKVSNFMSIVKFDLTTTNILTFQGVGKSASLSALLVGLGYDLLLEDYIPETLCGISVQDFIRNGSDECSIELIISLHAAPKLKREYGSHLKIIRKLERGLPLPSTSFQVASADVTGQFSKNPNPIGKQRLRRIQKHLGITPQFLRLLLLDEVNLRHVLAHPSSWYDYYGLTYNSRKAKLDARLQMLSLKYERIQGEVGWRKQKEEFLDNELNSQSENPWRERDEEEQKNLKVELGQLCERQNALETAMNSYLNELNKLSNTLTGRLKFRYQEFLHRQDFTGSIIVDDKQKGIGIWIVKRSLNGLTPKTVEDAAALWGTTPHDFQRLAVIGLFFALIDISESPIFFMDASSTRATEFSLPPIALPLLFELIEKKCSQGHQFVASLSDQTEAFSNTTD